ncbi:MAG: FAD-dependent oxidoreductase, partial [Candidatus Acidiferrales bacterium]
MPIVSGAQTYDVVVVGAGVFGAWTAYHLAREGSRVLLVDAYGTANSRSSSAGESRIIRMSYGADDVYPRWSMRSLDLWRQFCEETGARLFHRTGVLWLTHEADPMAIATLATFAKVGVPHKKLSREEIARRFPVIACQDSECAIYEPESGALMARRAVQAIVDEFQKAGGTYLVAEAEPPSGRGHIDALATWSGETLHASTYVFACGPWLPKVFRALLGHRIFPSRQEIYFFGVPPGDRSYSLGNFPTWLDVGSLMYGIPDIEGRGFKIDSDMHGPAVDHNTL